MPSQCCMTFCQNVGTHRFPTDPVKKAQWVKAVKRVLPGLKICPYSRICLDHFTPEDYSDGPLLWPDDQTKRRRLRRYAVPSIFNFTPRPREEDNTEDPLAIDNPPDSIVPDKVETHSKTNDSQKTIKKEAEDASLRKTIERELEGASATKAVEGQNAQQMKKKDIPRRIQLENVKVIAGGFPSKPSTGPDFTVRNRERIRLLKLTSLSRDPVGLKIDPKAVKKTYSRAFRRPPQSPAPSSSFSKTYEDHNTMVCDRATKSPVATFSKTNEDHNTSVCVRVVKAEPEDFEENPPEIEDSKDNVLISCKTNEDHNTLFCDRVIKAEPDEYKVCDRVIKADPDEYKETQTDKEDNLIEISIDTSIEIKREWPEPNDD